VSLALLPSCLRQTQGLHTAGLIGGRVAEALYPGLQVNLMGTINVAEAIRLTGVKRLVHISTHGVYDRRQEGSSPITEGFAKGGGLCLRQLKGSKGTDTGCLPTSIRL